MRCHICNAILNDSEIKFDSRHEEFDPCGRCLMEINEVFNDHPDDEEQEVEDLDEEVLGLLNEFA